MTTNGEAIEAWNTVLFDKFVRYRPTVVNGLATLGDHALARLAPTAGERIVDLGCGFGDPSSSMQRFMYQLLNMTNIIVNFSAGRHPPPLAARARCVRARET